MGSKTFPLFVKSLRHAWSPTVTGSTYAIHTTRAAATTLQVEVTRFRIIRSCSQGGVLPPLMQSLLIDGLLSALDRRGVEIYAHADDFVILPRIALERVASNILQKKLDDVRCGCQIDQISANTNKTVIISFIRRRELRDLTPLSFFQWLGNSICSVGEISR